MHPFSDRPSVPKRIAAVNDLTGFGRCSLAVVLPVLNAMKIQACPVPTSVFSSHMAFPSYYHRDLTEACLLTDTTCPADRTAEPAMGCPHSPVKSRPTESPVRGREISSQRC